MKLEPLTLVVPRGIGKLPVKAGVKLEWPLGSDVELDVSVINDDGTTYPISGTAGVLGLKYRDSDSAPFFQREWTQTGTNTAQFLFGRDERDVLAVGRYYLTIQFQDTNISINLEDTILRDSRVEITKVSASFSDPVSVLPSQVPLAQGPRGYLTSVGVYDPAVTYQYGQGVTFTQTGATSTYMFINATPSAGHAPPNATYWLLVASGATANVQSLPISFGNGVAGDAIMFDTTRAASGLLPAFCALENLVTIPWDPTTGTVGLAGWLLVNTTSGSYGPVTTGGMVLSSAQSGLTGADAGPVTVDYVTGRLRPQDIGETRYGYCDLHGNVYLLQAGFIG